MQKARFVARDRGEIPGSSPVAQRQSPLAASGHLSMTSSSLDMDSGDRPPMLQTSASWSGPSTFKRRMEPRDDDPVFPDWLVDIEAGAASRQMGKSMSSSFSQSKPKPIGRPLS